MLVLVMPFLLVGRLFLAIPAAGSAEDIVAKVAEYYESTRNFSAQFLMEVTRPNSITLTEGHLYITKPDKIRWDYDKARMYHLFDGTTLWVYDFPRRRATQESIRDHILPMALPFVFGDRDLAKDFVAVLDPTRPHTTAELVLKLTPTQPTGPYTKLWLTVDTTFYRVNDITAEDTSGALHRFTLQAVRMDPTTMFRDTIFTFNPPRGTRIRTP
jgi:outer membrane lipoprotein-sorting protein